MLELAARYGDPKPVRLAQLTEPHDIPQRFLVQILLQMKAGGLVNTTRGAMGGYQLARHPDSITLADILGTLDRMDEPAGKPTKNPSDMAARLTGIWQGLIDTRTKYLEKFTLSELLPKTNETSYVI